MKHFIRYGTNSEKQHIKKFLEDYSGIVINANMISMYAGSISDFLYDTKKEYFIDPLTHAFAHNLGFIINKDGDIKKSILKLSEYYGIRDIIEKQRRPLKHKDFENNSFINTFFENVTNFQQNIIHDNLDDEYKELIDFLGEKKEPSYIIAPYFYMDRLNYHTWRKINFKFLEIASEKKYYSQVVIDKHLLSDKDFIYELVNLINKTEGVFYWIDNFDETKATKEELKNLLNFIDNIEVFKVNLYGGYFSVLLKQRGLDGVIHGLEYGESRDVVPVGGGIPVAKYYFSQIKKRLKAEDVIEILHAKKINNSALFHSQICSCDICSQIEGQTLHEVVQSFISIYATTKTMKHGNRTREYPITESKINSLYHYLYKKNEEFAEVQSQDLNHLLEKLDHAYREYEGNFSDNFLDYLKTWQEVLSE
ncbi:hypothetical protein [Nitratifractor sp.]